MTSTLKPVPASQMYHSWKIVPAANWRWPNFSAQEIACRGTGKVFVVADAMDRLQHLRTMLGRPLILNSAYRSPEHNKRVKGVPNSRHLKGDAFDVSMSNQNPIEFVAKAKKAGFRGIGYYPKQGFIHIDLGPTREWGDKDGMMKQVNESVTPDFKPEPLPPKVSETLFKPETIVTVGTGIGAMGLGPALAANGPFAWAIGGLILVGGLTALFVFLRTRGGGEREPAG